MKNNLSFEMNEQGDNAGFAPRYHQVYLDLDVRIRSGSWAPGDPIPSEAELCKFYGVSRGTIQRAVRNLVEQGVLVRERGRATYVSTPKLEGSVLASYRESIDRPHDRGSSVIRCERVVANDTIQKIMKMKPGEEVYELERLRFIKGVPLSYQLSFLPADLVPKLENCNLESRHLHDLLWDDYKVAFLSAEEFLEPVKPDEYVAGLLNVTVDHPLFYVERISYLFDGRVGEFRRAHMRGDMYRFRIELR
ncbi:MAG: GntR family transcriptional regulator [Rhizobiaceae bacterium]|nr:GntR family transcriptional regulator [Rhizobiaceae bacterium]